jgi:hypothetical protein
MSGGPYSSNTYTLFLGLLTVERPFEQPPLIRYRLATLPSLHSCFHMFLLLYALQMFNNAPNRSFFVLKHEAVPLAFPCSGQTVHEIEDFLEKHLACLRYSWHGEKLRAMPCELASGGLFGTHNTKV